MKFRTSGETDPTKPFLFSRQNRYFILAFLLLAIINPIENSIAGRDPLSLSGISLVIACALSAVWIFWMSFDTIAWIRNRPEEFFRMVRPKRKTLFLSKKENLVWLYAWFSVLGILLGVIFSALTVLLLAARFM